ncbi:hypothetical protein ROLI_015150 [Roseobacter fucihabitans]|uniref:Uncharacterized protein n=1 Tax=Roseobacter fucihabitans TaxID=1537242 RepID=A0ABZ2BSL6_9RHOB|nr:hypothetical protein [Roseobacter litoralis]
MPWGTGLAVAIRAGGNGIYEIIPFERPDSGADDANEY